MDILESVDHYSGGPPRQGVDTGLTPSADGHARLNTGSSLDQGGIDIQNHQQMVSVGQVPRSILSTPSRVVSHGRIRNPDKDQRTAPLWVVCHTCGSTVKIGI